MSYYDVLGVPQTASFQEIRAAYMAQIKYFHPDVFPGNPEIARLKTLELNEAYEVLSHSDRRAKYDSFLEACRKEPSKPSAHTTAPPPPEQHPTDDLPRWKLWLYRLLVGLAYTLKLLPVIFVGGCLLIYFFSTHFGTQVPEESITPQPLPATGHVLSDNGEQGVAPLSVETKGAQNYCIKLKCINNGEDAIFFFVRGGDTAEIDVPLGTYELYYATGEYWYGTDLLFGAETAYYKADDTFHFYESKDSINGWTVTLYAQRNGNLDTKLISADDF